MVKLVAEPEHVMSRDKGNQAGPCGPPQALSRAVGPGWRQQLLLLSSVRTRGHQLRSLRFLPHREVSFGFQSLGKGSRSFWTLNRGMGVARGFSPSPIRNP